MEPKQQWGSRMGFILAAVGSAIGLGNIWRYPYVAYENGGGAFLIPYLVALLTTAIPILLMEYALGHKYRGSSPWSMMKLSKKFEWLGWFQVLLSFIIVTYYMVIIGWAASYAYYSLGLQWGTDTQSFFLNDYLGLSDSVWSFGGIEWKVFIPVLLLWIITYWVMRRGVRKGIELASRILLPMLVIMMLMITFRAITLEGASTGLNVLFTPNFAKMMEPGVWVAAYGQVFFSLSIGFATMISYASYLNKKEDLSNSGFIAAFANSGFEFLASIAVFGALGFLATQQNVPVEEVVDKGILLAFSVFPEIINSFPGLNALFGFMFFGALVFAGFTSAVSLIEPSVLALQNKLNLSRKAAINWICGVAFLISSMYTFKNGLNILDIVDHFVNNYGILLGSLLQIIVIGWVFKQLKPLQQHINSVSDVRVGSWWIIMLKYVSPIMLTIILASYIREEATKLYGDFPIDALFTFGYGLIAALFVAAVILNKVKWKGMTEEKKEDETWDQAHG
ncbi:sodium-dependent transporter [Hazenella coriacea]|uniref:NSS family neurotransmitter:Na+ symporter n=1 Tax=Hazenella coriacea TaxID=1179467 RepID=A0A4R3LAP6_9BACL|nr:sodium-dependent transporter [Hazenella coriacea]TCS96933.1 NSS family neurotransmitter:Na+ symporter [Hazenella coriacea]